MVPDLITYAVLIGACDKSNLADEVVEIFDVIQLQGLELDAITRNVLISACEKSGQPMRAFSVLKMMRDLVPDLIAYSALISACSRASWLHQACNVFQAL